MSNKSKMRKTMVMLSAVCMFSIGAAGCGSGDAPASETTVEKMGGILTEEAADTQAAGDTVENAEAMKEDGDTGEIGSKTGQDAVDMEKPQETAGNSEGKWQVLDAETAAAIDADFEGVVWKIEENSFFIAEEVTEILEDGSIVSARPASGVEIPDSDLIPVVFDVDTHFYMRTIYENGARYEDGEAGFSDLKTGISVDLKGKFEDDIFYADEIRILKVF